MIEMLPTEQQTLDSDKNYKGQLFLFSIFGERDGNVQMHTGNLLEKKNLDCNIQQTIYGHTFT